MKSRKNDLRTSRKSGFTEIGRISSDSSKPLRTLRSVSKSGSTIGRSKSASGLRTRSSVKESSNKVYPTISSDSVSIGTFANVSDSEYKRKRVDTTEYIKRRFLYDVAEAPRRLHRKSKSQRSTAALMAASSANLSQRKARHISKNSGPKITRLIRDYDEHSENNIALSSSKSRNPDAILADRKLKKSNVQLTAFKHDAHPHSSWDFPDIFECESPIHSDLTENGDLDYVTSDVHTIRNPTTEHYSNALPHDLFERSEKRLVVGRARQSSNQGLKKARETGQANKIYSKKPESFIAQSFFSADRSPTENPYPDDIISFCPNRISRRNGKPKHSDMDFTDGFSTSSHSPDLSDRQIQLPMEDIEEEELLAPELSILTATTCIASANGSIFTTFPQGGGFLTGAGSASGSSRRKSPVRPMQVLRTKAPPSINTMPSIAFGCNQDLNSQTNEPIKNGRRVNIDNRTDDGLSVSYQPLEPEPTNIDLCLTNPQMFQSTSVLRLTTPSMNNKATSITIRPMYDRSHKSDDKPSSVVEDGDKIPGSGSTHGSKSSRSGKAVLAKSLLLAPNATASRRRPSILRRSSGAPKAELDDENQKPVSRTIGAFTPRSFHSRRSGKATSELAGPTKLLQLITATSLASSTLTASEKLFGRRSGSQKQSLVTNVTMPVTESRCVDSVKTPVTTSNSCRYAVLRGSTNGKRYIVLGNNAIFDRSNITATTALPVHTSVETSVTDSHSPMDVHPSELAMSGSLDDPREALDRFGHSMDLESDSSQPLTTLDIHDSDPVSALIAT